MLTNSATIWLDLDPAPGPDGSFTNARQAVVVQFAQDVGFTLSLSDLDVFNISTNDSVPVQAPTYDAATRTARFPVATADRMFPRGNYEFTILASDVSPALVYDTTHQNHFSAADFNRDRRIDFADLVIHARNSGQTGRTWSQGDANFDGTVDYDDAVIIARGFNSTLPAPPDFSTTLTVNAEPQPANSSLTPIRVKWTTEQFRKETTAGSVVYPTTYRVYRRTAAVGGAFTQVSLENTSFIVNRGGRDWIDNSVQDGTKYDYRVRPVYADGTMGSGSQVRSATAVMKPVSDVEIAKVSADTWHVSWINQSATANMREIQISESGDFSDTTTIVLSGTAPVGSADAKFIQINNPSVAKVRVVAKRQDASGQGSNVQTLAQAAPTQTPIDDTNTPRTVRERAYSLLPQLYRKGDMIQHEGNTYKVEVGAPSNPILLAAKKHIDESPGGFLSFATEAETTYVFARYIFDDNAKFESFYGRRLTRPDDPIESTSFAIQSTSTMQFKLTAGLNDYEYQPWVEGVALLGEWEISSSSSTSASHTVTPVRHAGMYTLTSAIFTHLTTARVTVKYKELHGAQPEPGTIVPNRGVEIVSSTAPADGFNAGLPTGGTIITIQMTRPVPPGE
jgi:hypothetical protein